MKITTSALEESLYNRELAALNAELRKGLEIIDKALARYCPGEHGSTRIESKPKGNEEFDQWMNSLRLGSVSYYGGYYLRPASPDVAKAPEAVREAVLDYAIKQFLDQVAEIEEVKGLASDAYHTALNS